MEKGMELDLCNGPEDLMNFKINVSPDDGMYKKGKFVFDFKVPKTYPHDPPKVQCETTVFHPNIDMEGHVCLNILREDWKPVLTIQSVIMGLQFLMLEPNADDPLNKDARRPPRARPRPATGERGGGGGGRLRGAGCRARWSQLCLCVCALAPQGPASTARHSTSPLHLAHPPCFCLRRLRNCSMTGRRSSPAR